MRAPEVQADQVGDDVHEVGVQETGGQQAPILPGGDEQVLLCAQGEDRLPVGPAENVLQNQLHEEDRDVDADQA